MLPWSEYPFARTKKKTYATVVFSNFGALQVIHHLPKRIKGAESDDVNCAPGALYGLRHPSRVDGSSKKVTGIRFMAAF